MKSPHHSRNGFLTERGYELAQQISLEGLLPEGGVDAESSISYLDKVGSVSAMVEGEGFVFDDQLLDNQYRRFHNGSS